MTPLTEADLKTMAARAARMLHEWKDGNPPTTTEGDYMDDVRSLIEEVQRLRAAIAVSPPPPTAGKLKTEKPPQPPCPNCGSRDIRYCYHDWQALDSAVCRACGLRWLEDSTGFVRRLDFVWVLHRVGSLRPVLDARSSDEVEFAAFGVAHDVISGGASPATIEPCAEGDRLKAAVTRKEEGAIEPAWQHYQKCRKCNPKGAKGVDSA